MTSLSPELAKERRDRRGKAVFHWWRDLQPQGGESRDETADSENSEEEKATSRFQKGNRAALARLRRTGRPADALLVPETFDLIRRLQAIDAEYHPDTKRQGPPTWAVEAAVLAGTLAHIRTTGTRRFAQALGQRDNGENALYSELRFGRLMAAPDEDWDDRFLQLRRAMMRLKASGQGFRIDAYARDILGWSDHVRRDWTFAYYQQTFAEEAE